MTHDNSTALVQGLCMAVGRVAIRPDGNSRVALEFATPDGERCIEWGDTLEHATSRAMRRVGMVRRRGENVVQMEIIRTICSVNV